jgi:hypothetical protein
MTTVSNSLVTREALVAEAGVTGVSMVVREALVSENGIVRVGAIFREVLRSSADLSMKRGNVFVMA